MADTLASLTAAAHTGIARIRAGQNMRASGAARLSHEAISIIITFLDRLEDRLAACQVCRLWRAVALELPVPWPVISCYADCRCDTGSLKHVEVDHDHCYSDIEAPFAVVTSDIGRLSLLLALPGTSGLPVDLDLTVHGEDLFYGHPARSTEDVRKLILKGTQLQRPISRAAIAETFSLKGLQLDVLHPIAASASRITSLTISALCNNWLSALLCLPPMTALRKLDISSHRAADEALLIPDALLAVLRTSELPELPSAFPSLESLRVCGVSCTGEYSGDVSISSARIADLLGSMPELRSLELVLAGWPDINTSDRQTAAGAIEPIDADKLESIVLGTIDHADTGPLQDLMDILPINPGASITYRASRVLEGVLPIFQLARFVPTTLTVSFSPGSDWSECLQALLNVEAADAAGERRAAVVDQLNGWNGELLARFVDTSRLTSLAVNISAWNHIADGLSAREIERLEILVCESDVTPYLKLGPAPPSPAQLLLPALRTLSFAIHSSLRDRLADPSEEYEAEEGGSEPEEQEEEEEEEEEEEKEQDSVESGASDDEGPVSTVTAFDDASEEQDGSNFQKDTPQKDQTRQKHGPKRGAPKSPSTPPLDVPVSTVVGFILAVSPPGGLLENIVVGEGIRLTVEGAGSDPISQLKSLSQSLLFEKILGWLFDVLPSRLREWITYDSPLLPRIALSGHITPEWSAKVQPARISMLVEELNLSLVERED
ncbi:hypothetical protein AURDEDRAFT_128601 [Auricularia subglabra TFB-10046 SS5]|nr:hypothetical protein AURDEDRAFT_128601 [Auricularia subglabra TFB-10046 SS5]